MTQPKIQVTKAEMDMLDMFAAFTLVGLAANPAPCKLGESRSMANAQKAYKQAEAMRLARFDNYEIVEG